MEEERQVHEPLAAYAAYPTLDLGRLTMILQNDQPLAVIIPFDEYQRFVEERRRAHDEWSREFEQLLDKIHRRMPNLSSDSSPLGEPTDLMWSYLCRY